MCFLLQLGMYTLSIMTEISHSSYIVHAESFAVLFTNILNQLTDLKSNLAYYSVATMKNLVPVIGGNQHFTARVLEIINGYAQEDEKRTCDMLEILEELIEYAVSVVVPHIRFIIEMCLQIASNNTMAKSVQIKVVSVVGWLIRSKGKVVQKNKLVEPIIDVLISLMAQQPDDEGNEEYFLGDPDQFTSITVATQTLDLIALHIPAEKVVPYILTKVEPAIQGGDIYAQKAAYLALAVLAEGCSERIRHKYLEPFLKCVCSAIHNPNAVVRNAALFALGQFAEHLQPEISKYASELLPVLFECLSQIFTQMEIEKEGPTSLDRLFYALETFCENLDEGLMPYLPALMERLFVALDPNGFSMQLKRVALSTLGSAASAVKEGMLPYFKKIIEVLNLYINSDPNTDLHQLQCYAIESLAVVAQFIGAENFKPLAAESLQLGLRILDSTEDPDIKKSVYALFAALSIVMKDEIRSALPKIVKEMIESIQSSEGIVTHYEEDDKDEIDVYEFSDEDEDVEEDIDGSSSGSVDSAQCRYSVENSYNEEKEQACLALREICINTGFCEALLQFCIVLHKVNTSEVKQALYKALQMFVPKCAELIRIDERGSVVMVCLDAYSILLEELKAEVFVGEGHREAIMNCVIDVLTLKTMCQDTDLGVSEKKNKTAFHRGRFAFGTLAECMKSLNGYVEKFLPALMTLWMTGAKDASEEVRNNAIFGLGEMLLHGKDRVFSKYPEILQALSTAVAKETHAGTLDNICGALAKMIIVNSSGIPLEQVFPAFLQKLPLRDDFQENEAVINCFFLLYQQGSEILRQHLTDVIKVAVHIYYKEQTPTEEVKRVLIEFLKIVNRDFSTEFANAVSSLGPEATESIKKLFSS
ncbi:hypothetical protein NQ317_011346 [Molorchus minor]|uniref:Uncharacterized protein n=1 Tax=Molorchus minor TaxID=1323400 RepID=A0ABQ9ISS0_9CUCU|nr:hypothetical protein NQ317_011346 [Molorchus minor]